MTAPAPRRYQRNSPPGKGLTITLAPALRARIEREAVAQIPHVSLAAVIVAILKQHFGLTTEDEERAA